MKEIVFTRRFDRDFRRLKKQVRKEDLDYATIEYILMLLQRGQSLPPEFREHALEREYAGFLECHVEADFLLIYRSTRSKITFHRAGTHGALFTKGRRARSTER